MLSMRRLSWTWTSLFEFTDELGVKRAFTQFSPKAVAGLCCRAYRSRAERALADQLSRPSPSTASSSRDTLAAPEEPLQLHLGPLRHLLGFKSHLTRLQKGCLTAFISGATWPKARLHSKGLTDTPRCIFCGAVDDVDHRLFGPCSGKALDRKSWRELFPAYGIADRQRELIRKGFPRQTRSYSTASRRRSHLLSQ